MLRNLADWFGTLETPVKLAVVVAVGVVVLALLWAVTYGNLDLSGFGEWLRTL